MEKIQAILLAGGRGTRLAPLTDTLPKPLVPILDRPMMAYVLEHLRTASITNIAISVSYLGHLIEDTFGDGSKIGMQITYLREPEPMGTGGWAKLVDWNVLDDRFIVANADNLFWIDLAAFLGRHDDVGGIATIASVALPSDTVSAAELLVANDDRSRLVRYVDRSASGHFLTASSSVNISSGWYVMTPAVRKFVTDVLPFSNEIDLWPALASSGSRVGFYHATEPWFDSGTHERLARVAEFLKKKKEES